MQSCRLMNGQHQQIRPATQQSQAGPPRHHDPVTNQRSWTIHYAAKNLGVQNAHGGHVPLHNGAYSNRQGSNSQTSASNHQEASSQTGGHNSNDYYYKVIFNNFQNSSTNSQSGNPCLPASGFKVPTQDFHQNSPTQSRPNQISSNATYLPQDMSPNSKQPLAFSEKQTMGTQDGGIVTDFQHAVVQRGVLQNENRDLTKPISSHSASATSLTPEQGSYTSTMSASEHPLYSVQVVNNQVQGQRSTQHGFSANVPNYYMAISQPSGKKNIATHTPPSSYLPNTSQNTQQYPVQQCLNHNSGVPFANSSNSNSYKEHETVHLLAKKREHVLSSATQQQVLRHVGAGALCNSSTPSCDGCRRCPPPPYINLDYRKQQSVRTTTVTMPNQCNVQPGTMAASENSNNLNANQFSPCRSGQSLPSVRSRTQHAVSSTLRQNSVPNMFHDSAARNGTGTNKANDAFIPNKTNNLLIGLLNNSPLLSQLVTGNSPQGNETQSSVASGFEMLPSIQQNNSSVHSSPGHTATKAVAVVQPLPSLESQIPNSHASRDSKAAGCLSDPQKILNSQATAINTEAANLKDYEDSPQTLDSGTQNTRKEPELDVNVVPHEQNSVPSAEPKSQNSPKDQGRMQTSSTSPGSDLSSLPATPWREEALRDLIRDTEKAQKKPDVSKDSKCGLTILDMFWGGNLQTLHTSRTAGVLRGIFTDTMNFCKSYLTRQSVVLWQVNGSFEEQMKNYHVLKDDEVFSELPYKSSWLNVNEQLDEIDKEFGFPWNLKYHVPMPEISQTESQKDEVNTNSIPAIASEVPSTDFAPVDSDEEEEAATFEAPSIQSASPTKTDDDNDPCLSLKIQVLPPEEAKRFYDQEQNEMPQSMDTNSQAEKIMSSSMENETPEVTETTSSESKQETGEVGLTKEVCCLTRLLEMFSGSSTPSLCKCQNKEEKNYEESTNKILDNTETELKHNNQLKIISGSKFSPAVKGEDQVHGKEDQIVVSNGPELCSQMIDLTKDDQPESSEQNPQDISQTANSSNSDIIFISDDEAPPSSENCILNQTTDLAMRMSEHEDECGPEQLKSTETNQSGASVSDEAEAEKFCSAESEIGIQILDHLRSRDEAPDVAESSLETKGQTEISGFKASFSQCVKQKNTKRKHERLEYHDTLGPPQKVKKTVELMLFGSAQKDRHFSPGRKPLLPSLRNACNSVQNPPEVLTVKLSTLSEAVYTRNCSVKQQIHEKWRRSFHPTKSMYRNKLKRFLKDSLPGPSLKYDQISVSSETRVFDRHSQSLKMERSHMKKLRKEKKNKVSDHRSYAKNKKKKFMLVQNNGILKFSVLPSNFNFKDGASGRKESTDPVSGKY